MTTSKYFLSYFLITVSLIFGDISFVYAGESQMLPNAALIINSSQFKFAVLFRTFFFLPYVLSEVIAGILWQFIYNPQYGFVKALFTWINPAAPVPAAG